MAWQTRCALIFALIVIVSSAWFVYRASRTTDPRLVECVADMRQVISDGKKLAHTCEVLIDELERCQRELHRASWNEVVAMEER